uniref:Transmembrane protein n=1 Tax=Cacopsylla melanoneura TaxID=428564 RepID=A0A8D8UH43_9HEMI
MPKQVHTIDQSIPASTTDQGHQQTQYSTSKGVRTSVIPFSTSDAGQQTSLQQYSAKAGTRTSASTITKLSKSSIQEDMLEIWLDHQKFLQRHPEDDSFYSFLFVFFAVFASFVFVLIVYFVMFVV